jgi:DNA adenine methylase
MKPLLKWAGGKRHIAPLIAEHLPEKWDKGTYFEPFIGGAALYLYLKPKRAEISDVNARLTGFYRNIKNDHENLQAKIAEFVTEFDSALPEDKKDHYLRLRAEFNALDPSSLEASALMFVLNKLCFNGLYRENSKGGFNVPFGQKTKFPALDLEQFSEASAIFKKTAIATVDFESSLGNARSGDFVYLDPPYVPVDATANFTSYSSEGFGIDSQMRLSAKLGELESQGVFGLISNSDTPATREIYKGFRFVEISAPRMVSAKSSGRGQAAELLIMNY